MQWSNNTYSSLDFLKDWSEYVGNHCLVKHLPKISLVLLIRTFSEVCCIITSWSCRHIPVSNTKHCSDMTCSSGILQFPAVKIMKSMCIVWTIWQLFKLDRHELLIRLDTPPDAATIKNKIVFLILRHPHNFWLSRDWHILTI